jgi:hypothetical protein
LTSRKATFLPHKLEFVFPFPAFGVSEHSPQRHRHSPSVRRRQNWTKHHTKTAMSTAQIIHPAKFERSTSKFIATIDPNTIAIEATVTVQPSHVVGAAP